MQRTDLVEVRISGVAVAGSAVSLRRRARLAARLGGMLLVLAASGCATSDREYWEKDYLNRTSFEESILEFSGEGPGPGVHLEITAESLRKEVVGTATSGRIRVSHPEGLDALARRSANLLDSALRSAERDLSFTLPIDVHFVMVRSSGPLKSFHARYPVDSREFMVPLVIEGSPTSAADALSSRVTSLMAVWHEVFEVLLVSPWARPTALPDGKGALGRRSKNYARWFRDGFATYASYVLLDHLRMNTQGAWPSGDYFGSYFYDFPFTSLEEVGDGIFRWHQYDRRSKDASYYPASFGLFLLIESVHGRKAIGEIIRRNGELPFPDGAALRGLVADVIGEDPAAMAAQYAFPTFGFLAAKVRGSAIPFLVVDVDEGDAAAAAGLQVGDLLLAIDNMPIATPFDFELAVQRAHRRTGPVRMLVLREETPVELRLVH